HPGPGRERDRFLRYLTERRPIQRISRQKVGACVPPFAHRICLWVWDLSHKINPQQPCCPINRLLWQKSHHFIVGQAAHPLRPPFHFAFCELTKTRGVGSLRAATAIESRSGNVAMNEQILQEISEFCCCGGLAESTFGRRAVNDGKLANRLRNGGRITTDTLERIRAFMARNSDGAPARRRVLFEPTPTGALPVVKPAAPPVASGLATDDPQRNFRFFDNRQKYLLF